eukprot:759130-Hanusia_phi.AAC.1
MASVLFENFLVLLTLLCFAYTKYPTLSYAYKRRGYSRMLESAPDQDPEEVRGRAKIRRQQ